MQVHLLCHQVRPEPQPEQKWYCWVKLLQKHAGQAVEVLITVMYAMHTVLILCTQEEQRLVSNREATRDAWFRLLREASSAAGRSSGLQRDDFGSSHILQDPGMAPL